MKTVHFTLQGKGGVGKSMISSLLVQYLIQEGEGTVIAVDTDPVNATLAGYAAFNAQRLELMDGGSLIPRKFDGLIEEIIASEGSDFVIDNGASSFIPLSHYISENDVLSLIQDGDKEVVIHTVITGGQAFDETIKGFYSLTKIIPDNIKIVVWLNEFFGEVKSEGDDGVLFEELPVYTENKERVHGIIRLVRQTGSTFGEDVQIMLNKKMTFDEVAKSPSFGIMSKSRLNKVKLAIFNQLDAVFKKVTA